jgi:hypothetical protein
LSQSGKVDRKGLESLVAEVLAKPAESSEHLSAVENQLAAIWKGLIGNCAPGRADNFFDIGGHSLLAIKALNEIKQTFGVVVPQHMMALEELAEIGKFIVKKTGLVPRKSVTGRISAKIRGALHLRRAS